MVYRRTRGVGWVSAWGGLESGCMGGFVRWLRVDDLWPYYYVMYSFLLVYCGPVGNFILSSGAARLPLQYATGVRNLLVYLSLVSYYSIPSSAEIFKSNFLLRERVQNAKFLNPNDTDFAKAREPPSS